MSQTIESMRADELNAIRHDCDRASALLGDALRKAAADIEPFEVAFMYVPDGHEYRYLCTGQLPEARLTIRDMVVELSRHTPAAQTLAALLREVADTIEKETT